MIDRDLELREALDKYDEGNNTIWYNPPWVHKLAEAARLVADPDTLTISKVDGEWPEWFRMLADVDQIDALLEEPK